MKKLLLLTVFMTSMYAFSQEFSYHLTQKDTLYVLFDGSHDKMYKGDNFMYKNHDPKYYWRTYIFSSYWKEEKTSEEYDDSCFYDDEYNYRFVYGVYKEVLGFDLIAIYGNSSILKKPISFLKKNKHKIIDYKWLDTVKPPISNSVLKSYQSTEKKPTLFLIDKEECTKDSIILRNVVYRSEIIE